MKRYLPIALLVACAGVLLAGVVYLFDLRFETGDVYPEYSSLRSDPLGTMALFDSLNRLRGLTVRRDFSSSNRLPGGEETTYLHLASPLTALQGFPDKILSEIERFASTGGRFVITLTPGFSIVPGPVPKDLATRWNVDFVNLPLESRDGAYLPVRVDNESSLPLPEQLDWHNGVVLTELSPNWKRIYTRGDNAVVIERQFGRGSVVIATDSYFLSNEAMLNDRHADLLAWMIGSGQSIVFDEAHLGITERPGVAALILRYHLTWLVAALVVLAGLFIWKNSFSLIPPPAEQEIENYIEGKDGTAGFDNLLRRSLPVHNLFATCFNEWKTSAVQTRKHSLVRTAQAEAAFNLEMSRLAKDRDAVSAYRTISGILRTKIK